LDSTISRRIASTCAAFFCVDAKRVFTTTRCAKNWHDQLLEVVGRAEFAALQKSPSLPRRAAASGRPRGLTPSVSCSVRRVRLDNVDGIVAQAVVERAPVPTARCIISTSPASITAGDLRRRNRARRLCCCMISRSLSRDGYPMPVRSRNRSSCDSGRGYVPWCSMGFCVASTMNGRGRLVRVVVHRYLRFVHGFEQRGLRFSASCGLISSASTMLAKNRARLEIESLLDLVEYAGANHVRRQQVRSKLDALERAVERSFATAPGASVVLPTPGTSSTSRWPLARHRPRWRGG